MAELISNDKMQEVADLLTRKNVIGFIAPTGGGKSTRLVKFLAAQKIRNLPTIFVVEPTIEAVKYLHRYVSKQVKGVGYAAEGEIRYNDGDKIVYCTAGHIENKMRSFFHDGKAENVSFCSTLILDEAHRGSLEQDVICGLWIEAHRQGCQVPNLLLMSATLSMEETPFPRSPVVKVSVQTPFPVTIQYSMKEMNIESRDFYNSVVLAVQNKHRESPVTGKGECWLVFVPGIREVLNLADIFAAWEGVESIRMASGVTEDERNRVTSPISDNVRRIIVATNIAEASITIDNLCGIFDTMAEKYGETSQSGGFCLTLGTISKSSARQRAGRTGRTCPGFCYRFCTERQFEFMPEQRSPELFRIPLHSVIIKSLNCGLLPSSVLNPRIQAIRDESERVKVQRSIDESIKTLEDLNMITLADNTLRVMQSGKFAACFPLSIRAAAVLFEWICTKDVPEFPGIVMASFLDVYDPSFLYIPAKEITESNHQYDKRVIEYRGKYFSNFNGKSDLEVFIRIWHYMAYDIKTINPAVTQVKKWCRDNSVNAKKMIELLNLVRQNYKILTSMSTSPPIICRFTPLGVLNVLSPILEDVYTDFVCKRNNKDSSYLTGVGQRCSMTNRARLSISTRLSNKLVMLNYIERTNREGGIGRRIITLSCSLDVEDLPDKGPVINLSHYNISPQAEHVEENDVDEDEPVAIPEMLLQI